MKKANALALGSIALAISSQAPAWSGEYTQRWAWEQVKYRWGYNQICFFNNTPKKCTVNHGYRIPLVKGSDVDVYWEDGDVTTILYLNSNGPLKKGAKVLVNDQSSGTVVSIFNNTLGGKVIDSYAKIQSSTGNIFAYQYIMD